MSPLDSMSAAMRPSFPRVSGDEPDLGYAAVAEVKFSPRERG